MLESKIPVSVAAQLSKNIKRGSLGLAMSYMGIANTPTNIDQMLVLKRAMLIFQERTEAQGELWKEGNSLEQAFQIKHKAHRIYNASLQRHCGKGENNEEVLLDSALDLINYAVFMIRQLETETDERE